MIQISNKFNIGDKAFYINDSKLNKGTIQSITSITSVAGTAISYVFERCYISISESMVFASIDDATDYFLTEVKENLNGNFKR